MADDNKDARLEAVTLALFGAEFWPGVVPKGALENWATWELQARRFLSMYDAAHGYPVPERGGLLRVAEGRDPSEEEMAAVRSALLQTDGWQLAPAGGLATTERLASAAIRALDEHRAKKRGA